VPVRKAMQALKAPACRRFSRAGWNKGHTPFSRPQTGCTPHPKTPCREPASGARRGQGRRFAVSPDTRLAPAALGLARGLRDGLARAGGFPDTTLSFSVRRRCPAGADEAGHACVCERGAATLTCPAGQPLPREREGLPPGAEGLGINGACHHL
jgi:hypothetical protein